MALGSALSPAALPSLRELIPLSLGLALLPLPRQLFPPRLAVPPSGAQPGKKEVECYGEHAVEAARMRVDEGRRCLGWDLEIRRVNLRGLQGR